MAKQQWGVIPANVGVVTWIYPIKFTSVYSLVTTRYAAYFDSLTQYSDKEMALCYINVDKCRINRGNDVTERIYVIAIGQAQQWGYYKATSGSYTVTFPIAFSRQTCAVCVTNVNSGAGYPVTYTPNTSSIKITNKCYENFWIAVGFQQWGNSDETNRDATVTFPIAFSVLYSVVGVPKSSSNLSGSNSNFGVKSQNNKSFIANMYDNSRGYAGFNWCAFGKAQALPIYRQQYS